MKTTRWGSSMKTNKNRATLGAVLSMLLALTAMAQTGGTGAISGGVTDPSGAVVPQAEIKVTNVATSDSRRVLSGSNGSYLASLLPPGTCRIDVANARVHRRRSS